MRALIFFLSAALFTRNSYAQSGTCYFANGTALPDTPIYNEYEPCASGPTTTCCGTNRALPPGAVRDGTAGFTRDECMPNGLCRNRYIDPKSNGTEKTSYWIDFCTDKNVASKNCIRVCSSKYPAGNVRVTPCNGQADSETWCCGEKTDCCSTTGVVTLAQVLGGTLSSSVVSSATIVSSSTAPASASTSSRTSTTTANPVASEKAGASDGLSSGAIGGIVVGVVAGVALLGAAMFFAQRAKLRKKRDATAGLAEAPAYPPQYQAHAVEKDCYAHRVELPPRPSLTELPPAMPAELPAGKVSQR